MSEITIEEADGGYLLKPISGRIKVIVSFNDVVQYLAGYFGEKGVGEDWKP